MASDDTPQDVRIDVDFGEPRPGRSAYLADLVHDADGPVVIASTRPDYYRSTVGSDEHRAAYHQMHADAHGAGFADPEDADVSYEIDNAAELAADRYEEPEPDEPEAEITAGGGPDDPMPPMPGRGAADAEVATWEAWAQRQGQREWDADRAADARELDEQARGEDADLFGDDDLDIW